MGKTGFIFPAAQFISKNMDAFADEILSRMPNKYESRGLRMLAHNSINSQLFLPLRVNCNKTVYKTLLS